MNLVCKIPEECYKRLQIRKERIWYASPYDLAEGNRFFDRGYIIVMEDELIVTEGAETRIREPFSGIEDLRHQVMVGNGILILKKGGIEKVIARFSMKYLEDISCLVTGARWLSEGYKKRVVSMKQKGVCSRCGRGLRASRCLHCEGRMASLKRFLHLCGNFRKRLVLASACMVLASMVNLVIPLIQKNFIDQSLIPGPGTREDIFWFVGKMFFFLMLLLSINLLRNWWCATLGAGISMELRSRIYEQVQSLSLSFIRRRKPGDVMNRIINDTGHIRLFMEHMFSNMISTIIVMAGAFVAMIVMKPILTLCSTLLIVVAFVLSYAFRIHSRRIFRILRQKEDNMHSALQDIISGIRVVKVFGMEKKEAEKFEYNIGHYAKAQASAESFWAVFFPILMFIMGAGLYLAAYFGGLSVLNSEMTAGELTQYIAYTGILYGPLFWLNQLPMMFRRMVTSLERIYDILDEIPEVSDCKSPVRHEIKGEISLEQVTFGYESYNPVLEEVSLHVKAGEMIGLVGPSGAGKSTLINLVMRLYDVNRGTIKIDGIDIRQWDRAYFHSRIGVVLQETFLFSDTILNNLRFAKPDAAPEEIIQAAKAANAHDFIVKAPDGYNTYVGEHGYNLSGGQRQRIAIARAILTNPKILILDEATSALDTESEFLIQQAMERLQAGRTTFAIAHRLSTLRKADRLVVIEGHRIAEMGTHNELLEKGGIYAGLVEAQLSMQKLER